MHIEPVLRLFWEPPLNLRKHFILLLCSCETCWLVTVTVFLANAPLSLLTTAVRNSWVSRLPWMMRELLRAGCSGMMGKALVSKDWLGFLATPWARFLIILNTYLSAEINFYEINAHSPTTQLVVPERQTTWNVDMGDFPSGFCGSW